MKIRLSTRVPRMLSPLLISLLFSLFHPLPLFAGQQDKDDHQPDHAKVVGGYFEEWSIYFAGFNIANLQANGVADKLTHLSYAFGNATPSGCAIADS
jgi:chitinase